jgi:tetratricopeptide (TPR) repeat protein
MNDNNHKILQIQNFLEKEPNDCFLLHALALEHVKIGDLEQAKVLFEKVLEIDAQYIGTYYHLGHLYEEQQNVERAIQVYEKGIEVAKGKKEMHAMGELRSALENLLY